MMNGKIKDVSDVDFEDTEDGIIEDDGSDDEDDTTEEEGSEDCHFCMICESNF